MTNLSKEHLSHQVQAMSKQMLHGMETLSMVSQIQAHLSVSLELHLNLTTLDT